MLFRESSKSQKHLKSCFIVCPKWLQILDSSTDCINFEIHQKVVGADDGANTQILSRAICDRH